MKKPSLRSSSLRMLAGSCVPLACASFALAMAPGTIVTWNDENGGSWGDAARWSPMQIPDNNLPGGPFSAVLGPVLANPTMAYTVTLDMARAVNNFDLQGDVPTLSLGVNALTIECDFTQAGGVLMGGVTTGEISIAGITRISNALGTTATIMGVSMFNAAGDLLLENDDDLDICDTCIDHTGTAAVWSGAGNINMMTGAMLNFSAASTFTITNDQTMVWDTVGTQPTLMNAGTIVKSTGAATTSIMGVALTNTGMLRVETGTLQTDGVDLTGNILSGGSWEILDNATLDFVGGTIETSDANVTLRGANSSFAAFDSVETVTAAGSLTLAEGRDFTTAADFQNDGALMVDDQSSFTVAPGADFLNYTPGTFTLAGGVFDLGGTLRFDNADIRTLQSDIRLDGPQSAILNPLRGMSDALTGLETIGAAGALALLNDRSLATTGSLTVASTGRVSVDPMSELSLGGTLTNFNLGVFEDGEFDLRGRILFAGAAVNNINTILTLDGANSGIFDNTDVMNPVDAFSALDTIGANGVLTLRNGRTLTVTGSLNVLGQLIVEGGGVLLRGGGQPGGSLTIEGDLTQQSGRITASSGGELRVLGTFFVEPAAIFGGDGEVLADVSLLGRLDPGLDSETPGALSIAADAFRGAGGGLSIADEAILNFDIAGLTPGLEHDQLIVAGAVSIDAAGDGLGATLRIRPRRGFAFQNSQDVTIMRFASRTGDFAAFEGMHYGSLVLVPEWTSDSLILHVVPSPAPAAAGALFAAFAAARRRRA